MPSNDTPKINIIADEIFYINRDVVVGSQNSCYEAATGVIITEIKNLSKPAGWVESSTVTPVVQFMTNAGCMKTLHSHMMEIEDFKKLVIPIEGKLASLMRRSLFTEDDLFTVKVVRQMDKTKEDKLEDRYPATTGYQPTYKPYIPFKRNKPSALGPSYNHIVSKPDEKPCGETESTGWIKGAEFTELYPKDDIEPELTI